MILGPRVASSKRESFVQICFDTLYTWWVENWISPNSMAILLESESARKLICMSKLYSCFSNNFQNSITSPITQTLWKNVGVKVSPLHYGDRSQTRKPNPFTKNPNAEPSQVLALRISSQPSGARFYRTKVSLRAVHTLWAFPVLALSTVRPFTSHISQCFGSLTLLSQTRPTQLNRKFPPRNMIFYLKLLAAYLSFIFILCCLEYWRLPFLWGQNVIEIHLSEKPQ